MLFRHIYEVNLNDIPSLMSSLRLEMTCKKLPWEISVKWPKGVQTVISVVSLHFSIFLLLSTACSMCLMVVSFHSPWMCSCIVKLVLIYCHTLGVTTVVTPPQISLISDSGFSGTFKVTHSLPYDSKTDSQCEDLSVLSF